MYFAPYKTCNLRCSYCYVPEYNKSTSKINDNRILESLSEFINKVEVEGYEIGAFCLHGAEPSLMSPESLAKAVKMVNTHWEKTNCRNAVAIQSNGIRFDSKYLAILKRELGMAKKNAHIGLMQQSDGIKQNLIVIENGVEESSQCGIRLGFSIDPPKALHDKYRDNTFDKAVANYEQAIKMNFPVSILSVVTNQTINYLNEFRNWMLAQLERKRINGNPYRVKIKFATGEMALSEAEIERFAYFLLENDLTSLVQILSPGYCLQSGNECEWFEFDIDGNCYSCNKTFFDEGIFANWHNESFDKIFEKRAELYSSAPEHEDCRQCPYEYLCNSGCPIDRIKTGDMAGKAHECSLIRIVFDEILRQDKNLAEFYHNNL